VKKCYSIGPSQSIFQTKQIMALKHKSNSKPQLKFKDNALDNTHSVSYCLTYPMIHIGYPMIHMTYHTITNLLWFNLDMYHFLAISYVSYNTDRASYDIDNYGFKKR